MHLERRTSLELAIFLACAGVFSASAFSTIHGQGPSPVTETRLSDGTPLRIVDVPNLAISYAGRVVTWEEVHELQRAGRARYVEIENTDAAVLAVAFDTKLQDESWRCKHLGECAVPSNRPASD